MHIQQNKQYQQQFDSLQSAAACRQELSGKAVLVAGASGTIGSALVDYLMYLNAEKGADITVYALGRNPQKLAQRFEWYKEEARLHFLQHDITQPLPEGLSVDYIIHAASDAHPIAYSQTPVDIMEANYVGARNILSYAKDHGVKRFLYLSSGEIYGQSTSEEGFDEDYSGPIDSLDPRSCYPMSKRAAETLCACFCAQYGVDSVIARPCHIYGPTLPASDTKAIAQFMRNALAGEDIVMKSEGTQVRSYCSVFDCVDAMMWLLLRGEAGQAYNIANEKSVVSVRQLAEAIASSAGRKVVFEIPDSVEKSGYTPVLRGVLNAKGMKKIGWEARVPFEEGLQTTMQILREI